MQENARRILLYSHDSFGLGHIRRINTIARRLSALDSQVSLLYVTGSPQPEFFQPPPRFDYVKIPCVTKDAEGQYVSRDLPASLPEVVKIRSMAIQSILASYDPDAVIIDHTPLGLGGELVEGLRSYRRRRPDGRVILGWRDIIDSPERTRRQFQRNRSLPLVEELYDQILVYGHSSILDVATEYELPPGLVERVRYVGVVSPFCDDCPEPQCRPPAIPSHTGNRVLVCAGGGADGHPLLQASIEAIRRRPRTEAWKATLVSGPFMDAAEAHRIESEIAGDDRFEYLQDSDDMLMQISQADVVLSMGGYNSVYEALTLRKRVLVCPRRHPREEQLERAQRLERLGLVGHITPDMLVDPSRLERLIVESLDRPPASARGAGLGFSGACNAARMILGHPVELSATGADSATAIDSTPRRSLGGIS